MSKAKKEPVTAEEFDVYFEDHDVSKLLDKSTRMIHIDFPKQVLRQLDLKAKALGLSRQALVKFWVAEKLGILRPRSS